jgi:hypothetical protein
MATMFRYSFVLVLGLLAAGPAAAASWADGMFDESSKDFGSVARGPALSHPFRVKNNTKDDVNISNVRVSCGCTSAWAVKTHLKPGEETAIMARMDTTRFIGPKTVTIFVQFDQPQFDEVRLSVTANGRTDFAVSPEGFTFGTVKRGSQAEAAVTVNFYGNDIKVVEAKTESNYIKATVAETKDANGATAWVVKAKLRNDVPVGKWFSDVWLKTNNPGLTQIRVPLNVEVEAALSVTPDAVALGAVKIDGEAERRIIIRGAQPFKITKIDGLDEQLTAKDNTEESKQVHVLTVKFKPEKAGDLAKKLHIITDLKDDNEVDVKVSAQVNP